MYDQNQALITVQTETCGFIHRTIHVQTASIDRWCGVWLVQTNAVHQHCTWEKTSTTYEKNDSMQDGFRYVNMPKHNSISTVINKDQPHDASTRHCGEIELSIFHTTSPLNNSNGDKSSNNMNYNITTRSRIIIGSMSDWTRLANWQKSLRGPYKTTKTEQARSLLFEQHRLCFAGTSGIIMVFRTELLTSSPIRGVRI